jgi:hypothetical protein
MRRAVVSNPERKAMRRMREQGATVPEIQRQFPHWTLGTVQSHVRGIQPVNRVSPEQRASMRAMRASGMAVDAIADNFRQFSYGAVWSHVNDVLLLVPVRPRHRRVDPIAVLRLRDEAGLKFPEIGERFGVSKVAAFQAYRQAKGGALPPKPVRVPRVAPGRAKGEANGWSKLTADDIRRIRASTLGSGALAADLGVSSRAIRYVRQGVNWGHVA